MGDINRAEQYAVTLGAFLHDIGKFVQRAQDKPKAKTHSQWGHDWFQDVLSEKIDNILPIREKEIVRSAISNHHVYEKYITLADAISSGMDRKTLDINDEETGDPFSDRLISIFSRISLSYGQPPEKYHRLSRLGSDKLRETFPVADRKCTAREYSALLSAMSQEIQTADFQRLHHRSIVDYFHFLLWKYTWCIPSAAYKHEPDVSLFDHLKTTAAIAGVLYLHHLESPSDALTFNTPAFCLIGGDISGIQNYIFNVLCQQGRIAKRLRARSLFVQLLSEIASHKVLRIFGLSLCNIIGAAGGNFYILAPNLKSSGDFIRELQREFDSWTMKHLQGELSITLAHVVVAGTELTEFSQVLTDKLKPALNTGKYKQFTSVLSDGRKWRTSDFLLPEVIEADDKACSGCRRRPRVEQDRNEENLCQSCLADIDIGRSLPLARYIAFFDKLGEHEIFGNSFELWGDDDLKVHQGAEPYLILSLNDSEMKLPVIGFKFLATHIPMSGGQPLTFDSIAEKAGGDKLLGYVKADVDNLGDIIRKGFRVSRPSISRFSAFSAMLEIFFSGHLQTRLISEYADMYTIFSGGDDFFVVGPWDQAIEFARNVKADFSDFCGQNPDMKFSAGMMLAKPHEPLSFCSAKVDENLKAAKSAEGKNRVRIFDQTLTWSQLDRVIQEADRVFAWLESSPAVMSRGFAVTLRNYAAMSSEYDEKKDTRLLRFIPHLHYDIKRNLMRRGQEEAQEWAVKLSPTIIKDAEKDHLPYLKAIMEYVLTKTRS
jgi:CRISPR-associated protein Csm1